MSATAPPHRGSGRVDAFVDAAFAFCMTLLVVAGGALPQTIDDLMAALLRIPAFGVAFALLALFWWSHHQFRQLHDRDDGPGLLLSLIIVFVVMIYVYPLRLLGESTAHYLSGRLLPGSELVHSVDDMRVLYVVYGAGFVVLAGLYVLLFRHATRNAQTDEARRDGIDATVCWSISASIGCLSIALALLLPRSNPWSTAFPGMVYMLIPALIGLYFARKARTPLVSAAAE